MNSSSQWMRFDRVLTSTKDRRRFPQFTRETAIGHDGGNTPLHLRPYLERAGFHEAFHGRLWLRECRSGEHLRRSRAGNRVHQSQLSRRTPSAQVCSARHCSWRLSSRPDETSPTSRGLFVREQFLCQHVADPPPGVNTNLPPVSEAKPQTNRDRLAEHTLNKSCAGCHNLIDPIGFGLEKFDAIGARRDKLQLRFFGERRDRETPAENGRTSISIRRGLSPESRSRISPRRKNSARCWRAVHSARNVW